MAPTTCWELACRKSCDHVSSEYLVGDDITSHFVHTAINKMHSFSCDHSKRWLLCSLLHLLCIIKILQIIFEFPATSKLFPFTPKNSLPSLVYRCLPHSNAWIQQKFVLGQAFRLSRHSKKIVSSSCVCCCTRPLHSGLLLQCNPDVLHLVNLLTFNSETNLRGRLFSSTPPKSSAANTWFFAHFAVITGFQVRYLGGCPVQAPPESRIQKVSEQTKCTHTQHSTVVVGTEAGIQRCYTHSE